MKKKEYHVHGFGAATGRKLAVYMYDDLDQAIARAKAISKNSKLNSTITRLQKDGRSYKLFMEIVPKLARLNHAEGLRVVGFNVKRH